MGVRETTADPVVKVEAQSLAVFGTMIGGGIGCDARGISQNLGQGTKLVRVGSEKHNVSNGCVQLCKSCQSKAEKKLKSNETEIAQR